MADLKALYQEIILDHNKNPRNFRVLADATRMVEAYNPLCGDHYTIYIKMDGDKVVDVSFQGAGCAISKSSASVMSSLVKGKQRDEAVALFEQFHHLVLGEIKDGAEIEGMGKLAAFSGVSDFPARVKCAILPWHTMKSALLSDEQTVSTE
jgi:nitrogen fixation NifU-like protein